jgi:MFS family permease
VLSFAAELIPFYPVYPLLFASEGLTGGQISLLFGLWSVTGFVLEVPAGALADRLPRRHLLVAAQFLRAAGFACWTVWPSFAGFALGFAFWGAGGAAASGTWEALLFEELGSGERYVRVLGRAEALEAGGSLLATVLAGPLLVVGGYPLVGWASVAACLLAAAIASRLPLGQPPKAQNADNYATRRTAVGGYVRTLRGGVSEALRDPVVGRLVIVVALLSGVTAVEEYFALLAGGLGLPAGVLPLLLVLPPAALLAGAELGGRFGGLPPRRAAWLVALGGSLLAVGALSRQPLGFAGIAVGYGVLEGVALIAGARLQESLTGPRATVTSVSAVAAEGVALAVFGAFGALSGVVPLPVLTAASVLPVIGLAVVLPRWLTPALRIPAPATQRGNHRSPGRPSGPTA